MTLDPEALDRVERVGGAPLMKRLVEVARENILRRLDEISLALAALDSKTVDSKTVDSETVDSETVDSKTVDSKTVDSETAERAAHSVKSSAAYLGVEELRALAEEMETAAREGRSGGLEADVERARRLLDAAVPLLREEIRRRG